MVIMPSVSINDKTKFDALLNVMKGYNNETVRKLGETISCMLHKDSPTDKTGKMDYYEIHVMLYITYVDAMDFSSSANSSITFKSKVLQIRAHPWHAYVHVCVHVCVCKILIKAVSYV